MKIGFIGLGIMGRPMALNLKHGGHDLIVPERASLTPEIRAAASVVADARGVAAQSEAVIVMVPDTPDVESVLFGAGGVASVFGTADFITITRTDGADWADIESAVRAAAAEHL